MSTKMPRIPEHVQAAFEARGHVWLGQTLPDKAEGLAYRCRVSGLRHSEQWVCRTTIEFLARDDNDNDKT